MDTLIYALLSKKISEITVDIDKKLIADVEFSYNSTSGELGIILKNDAGEIVAETSIDLPIEKTVEHAYYDADTKELVFELVGGDIVRVPVGDLIADLKQDLDEHIADDNNPHHVTATQVGLGNVANLAPADLPVSDATQAALNNKQDIIDSENKLSADLVDDGESDNKFVTTGDKAAWNAKYDKPNSGIPDTDIASATIWNAKQDAINDLQTIREGAALGVTALQEVPSEYITETELSNYHDATKQDAITDATELEVRRLFRILVDITVNILNGTYTGDSEVYTKESAEVTVSPNLEYELPDNISVSNASFTYNKATGIIELSNVSDDVLINVVCVKLPTPEIPTIENDSLSIQDYSGADAYDIYADGEKVATVEEGE